MGIGSHEIKPKKFTYVVKKMLVLLKLKSTVYVKVFLFWHLVGGMSSGRTVTIKYLLLSPYEIMYPDKDPLYLPPDTGRKYLWLKMPTLPRQWNRGQFVTMLIIIGLAYIQLHMHVSCVDM